MPFRFTSLFIACLVALCCTEFGGALPLARKRPGMITLALKPVPSNDNIHPTLRLQQHLNGAHRRVNMKTRRSKLSNEALKDKLVERINTLDVDDVVKTYNIAGTHVTRSTSGLASRELKCDVANPPPECNNSLKLDIVGNDVGYFATIEIGTPQEEFRVLMDSGSSDLWIGSENCQTDKEGGGGDCGNHRFLGSNSSSSFVDMKVPWEITYGSGHVEGTKVLDTVTIGSLRLGSFQFGVANLESKGFSSDDTPFDGLMGLALSSLSEQQGPTFIEALVASQTLDEAIVSYRIPRRDDNEDNGEITFGGLDRSKFDQDTLVTLPNTDSGFWIAQTDGATVNGKDLGLGKRKALLDTGTTLFVAPEKDAKAIHDQIEGATVDQDGQFHVPCDTNATVALVFGGRSFDIDPKDLTFARLGGNDCLSGIQSQDDDVWLVGDTFLKNVYFSTNANKNEISLANLK